MARQTVGGRPAGCSCPRMSRVTVWRVGGNWWIWSFVVSSLSFLSFSYPSSSVFCPRLTRGGHPPPTFVRWNYWYMLIYQYERGFSSLPTRCNLLLWTSEYALWSFKSLLKNGRLGLEGGLLSLWNTPVLTTWISRDFFIFTCSKVTALHFVHYWMCL